MRPDKKWNVGEVGLSRGPVKAEATGSSPVRSELLGIEVGRQLEAISILES